MKKMIAFMAAILLLAMYTQTVLLKNCAATELQIEVSQHPQQGNKELRDQIAGQIFSALVAKGTQFIASQGFPRNVNFEAAYSDSVALANEVEKRLRKEPIKQ